MSEQQNPILNAIDNLHAAFVGEPAKQTGEPVAFAAAVKAHNDRLIPAMVKKGLIAKKGTGSDVELTRAGYDAISPTVKAAAPAPVEATAPAPAEEKIESIVPEVANLGEAVVWAVLNTLGGQRSVEAKLRVFNVAEVYAAPIIDDAAAAGLVAFSTSSHWHLTDAGKELAVARGWMRAERAAMEPTIEPTQEPAPTTEEQVTPAHAEVITEARARVLLDTTTLAIRSFVSRHPSLVDLEVLHRVESAGKARKTVLTALEARGVGLPGEEPIDFDPATAAVVIEGPDAGKVVEADVQPVEATEPADVVPPTEPEMVEVSAAHLIGLVRDLERTVAELVARVAALEAGKAQRAVEVKPVAVKPAKKQSTESGTTLGDLSPGTFAQLKNGALRLVVSVGQRVSTVRVKPDGSIAPGSDNTWTAAEACVPDPDLRAAMVAFLPEQKRSELGL